MHNNQRAQWAAGLGLTLLTLAAFAGGQHLRPAPLAGHDLYRSRAAQVSAGAASGAHTLVLTGTPGGLRVADAAAGGLSPQGVSTDADTDASNPAATFQAVYNLLRGNYVEGVPDDSKMSHGAVSAMLASLQDPATRFLEADEFAEARREMQGQFAGIGAVTDIRESVTPKAADDITRDKDHPVNVTYALTLVSVLPGSPAENAGLHIGDVVTDINGQWVASYDLVSAQAKALKAAQDKNDPVTLNNIVTALQKKLDSGLTLAQAETKLRDPKAKALTLTVTRAGTPLPLTVKVEPAARIDTQPFVSRVLSGGAGYIKAVYLTDSAGASFAQTLGALGPNVKGLVLDLRGTAGGTPEDAAGIAAKLTTGTTLGQRVGKGLKTTPIPITPAKAIAGPVVVLVNNGTAGASELLASALQAGGAKLIGSPTFGDDKDVRTISLPDGTGFTLTVGELLTASGAHFGGTGIVPDIAVPGGSTGDPVLERAVSEVSGRVARR